MQHIHNLWLVLFEVKDFFKLLIKKIKPSLIIYIHKQNNLICDTIGLSSIISVSWYYKLNTHLFDHRRFQPQRPLAALFALALAPDDLRAGFTEEGLFVH